MQAGAELGGRVEDIDITGNVVAAQTHPLFSPFMTIINDRIRIPGPVAAPQFTALMREIPTLSHAAIESMSLSRTQWTINGTINENK